MPEAMADGIVKIAVLVNLEEGDNSRQFIEGCVAEGRSMGFTVDAFVSGADEKRCRELAAGIAQADYDGLIFSHGAVGFSYDILQPAAEKGMRIVTFEALPYRDGRFIKDLIATFQDDYRLARLSLETLISYTRGNDGRAARVIRIGCDPGITFLDRRAWEFDRLTGEGTIEQAALVRLGNLENPRSAAWEALAAALPRFPPGSVDAVWVPWDEFAVGCAEALAAAGRQDIKLFSIGISNDDMRLMQRHADIWLANTAVDPKLAGTVNMRILAAGLAGETLSDTFSFDPQLVKTADLNRAVNMANIAALVPDWGDGTGLFDHYQWMADVKAAEGKYFRIAPPGSPPPRAGPPKAESP
jgi:simple sugar transport system substrate-binding protein